MKRKQKSIDALLRKKQSLVGKTLRQNIAYRALEIDEDKKTAKFVMSTETEDRHGDIIDQESWILRYFLQNPIFFLNHRSDKFPIGKWLDVWLEDDPDNPGKQRLVGVAIFRTEFEDADRAFRHLVEGDMNMVSVGFIPHLLDYDEDRDAIVLFKCELLECSLVGVGSNRGALLIGKDDDRTQDAESDDKTEDDEQSENDEKTSESAREQVIRARNAFNKEITGDPETLLQEKKRRAREHLDKAIRQMR